jgi:hypothetical protein
MSEKYSFTDKAGLTIPLISLAGILLGATASQVQAATIISLPGTPSTKGIGYEWEVSMSKSDVAELTRYVGAFSWNERNPPFYVPPNEGWTHTSNWVKLKLTSSAQLTVAVERAAGIQTPNGPAGEKLFPAFTLYKKWQTEGPEDHFYNPRGNVDWAYQISYLAHKANGGTLPSVAETFTLPKGEYTVALGGDPPEIADRVPEGYKATLSTTPVPEPRTTGGLLVTAAGIILGVLSRRKMHIG